MPKFDWFKIFIAVAITAALAGYFLLTRYYFSMNVEHYRYIKCDKITGQCIAVDL